jgi:uncharacterized protein (DUF342 family)|tara:strand:+ start:9130 stop:9339 length:210 start_codon:yes stop_codon:yes gene_type:complete
MSVYSGSKLYEALKAKYEAEIMEAKANIEIYLDNKVGVAEHPNVVESLDKLIEQLASAEDKLRTLKQNY